MRIKVQGGQFFVNGYPVREGFSLREGECRLVSCIAESGAGCATLCNEGGELIIRGNLDVVRWGHDAELLPLPCASMPALLREYAVDDRKIYIAVGREITCEGICSFRHTPPFPIRSPRVEILSGQKKRIANIRGECDAGEYIALFSLSQGSARLLLEAYGESIQTEGNEVAVTRKYNDLRGRVATARYTWKGENFEESYRNVECTHAHSFIREDAGRLLLEAAFARDVREITSLLSPEIADADEILRYFGEIECVRAPLFVSSPTAIAVQKKTPNGRMAITYDFSFEGTKINNILCLDDC